MSGDYYEELGVEKSASPEEIRAAFRRRAKRVHPDKGGSTEEMARLNRAYETLSSKARRLTYDKTGKDRPEPVDPKAQSIVVEHCKKFLASEGLGDDMLYWIRKGIRKEQETMQAEADRVISTVRRGRAKLKKLKRKKRGPSFIHQMLNFELNGLEQGLEELKERIGYRKRALELLEEYEDTTDPKQDNLSTLLTPYGYLK